MCCKESHWFLYQDPYALAADVKKRINEIFRRMWKSLRQNENERRKIWAIHY